jgi:hypothetical protein
MACIVQGQTTSASGSSLQLLLHNVRSIANAANLQPSLQGSTVSQAADPNNTQATKKTLHGPFGCHSAGGCMLHTLPNIERAIGFRIALLQSVGKIIRYRA